MNALPILRQGVIQMKKTMTLKTKINLLVLINIIFVLLLAMFSFAVIIIHSSFSETRNRAMFLSKTVGGMPQVVEAFNQKNPSKVLQPLAEKLLKQTKARFIIITNKNFVRYSHPNPNLIGKKFQDKDDKIDLEVLKGKDIYSITRDNLGLTVRAKSPIYDGNHNIIGLVSVGYPVNGIWIQIFSIFIKIIAIGVGAFLFGVIGAFLLSSHIKKQIFDMEPNEIAYMTKEQKAILNSVREGILAINSDGEITACNLEAQKMIGKEEDELKGESITTILPSSRMMEVIEKGIAQRDEPMIIGKSLVIANSVPVSLNGRVIGVVTSFRDKMQLDKIDHQLADIGHFVEALRSLRHEFMNKLHLISGLIQLKEYKKVNKLIGEINEEQQNLLNFFLTKIHDPAVIGVLVGKMSRAKELNIQLKVHSQSIIKDPCPHEEIVLTLLSNSIENSLEAITSVDSSVQGQVIVSFQYEEKTNLVITVSDNGPGIEPRLEDDIFRDGVTTKGEGRGFGLALLASIVKNIGGRLSIESSQNGVTLIAKLPVGGTET